MSLSIQAVDRIFARMAATYGAAWDRSLGQAPISDVKTAWAHELHWFSGRLNAIAWALENLPERCPNVIEFRNLCRNAPAPEEPRLELPKADPERVRAELAKLAPLLNGRQERREDGLAWARRIVARVDGGAKVAPMTLAMARDALDRRPQARKEQA